MDENILKSEERAILSLRALYRRYGYSPYKMSKFEEYEYYIRNKDFLISDRIITFNDTNGKLLALKPDVTLSIIKNGEDIPGYKQKVCYNENIYRISESTGQYKEIMQTGLECIGDIDLYDIFETVSLAAQSLALISDQFILQISHLGVLSAALNYVCDNPEFQREAISCISGKNAHDLISVCKEYGLSDQKAELLSGFVTIYGSRNRVLEQLDALCGDLASQSIKELKELSKLLDRQSWGERIIFDFSVVNNMSYYNGIVFTGFLNGISEGILAGGQYDKLMRKLNRKSGAIGFAVYLDLLEQLPTVTNDYDVDVLLVYPSDLDAGIVMDMTEQLIGEGKTVCTQKRIPAKLRYRELITLSKEGTPC